MTIATVGDFWDHVSSQARHRRWRDALSRAGRVIAPERTGNACGVYGACAFGASKRKGDAWPGVVDDPWNRKRRTNVHNAKNNRRPTRIWPIYGVPK